MNTVTEPLECDEKTNKKKTIGTLGKTTGNGNLRNYLIFLWVLSYLKELTSFLVITRGSFSNCPQKHSL